MAKLTLESLAKRVKALEAALAEKKSNGPPNDWRQAVGMFAGSEFMKRVDAEGRRIREADRAAARREADRETT